MTPKEAHDVVRDAVIRSQGYDVKRPPTMRYGLADVLLAIWKQPKIKDFSQKVVMQSEECRETISIWNLRDDNLNAQSNETLLLLANFLGEK